MSELRETLNRLVVEACGHIAADDMDSAGDALDAIEEKILTATGRDSRTEIDEEQPDATADEVIARLSECRDAVDRDRLHDVLDTVRRIQATTITEAAVAGFCSEAMDAFVEILDSNELARFMPLDGP